MCRRTLPCPLGTGGLGVLAVEGAWQAIALCGGGGTGGRPRAPHAEMEELGLVHTEMWGGMWGTHGNVGRHVGDDLNAEGEGGSRHRKTAPATTSTTPSAPITPTRQRHHKAHRPQRPTERSDPTQHAKGRTGDCPGPRKGTATRRNVTQGGGGGQEKVGVPKCGLQFPAPSMSFIFPPREVF